MKTETIPNDFHDKKCKALERNIYILEQRRLGSDFCKYCDEEFRSGSEKERKEKDIHIRNTHTFECNVCVCFEP